MEEYKIYCLFNKKTRLFICFTPDLDSFPESIRSNFLIKEYNIKDLGFDGDEINLSRFRWEGTYDEGSLIDMVTQNKTVVTEQETNTKFNSIFFERYGMVGIIKEIIRNMDFTTEEGKQMKEFFNKVEDRKQKAIEFYKSSPNHIWETTEGNRQREKDIFK